MITEIKTIVQHIDEFGDEIHKTHLAYATDKNAARRRAKELIDDIVENGLEQTTITTLWKRPKNTAKTSYNQLCDTYQTITLEYTFAPCGGELRWVLN